MTAAARRATFAFFADVVTRLDAIVDTPAPPSAPALGAAARLVEELLAHRAFLRGFCQGTAQLARQPELAGRTFRYPLFTAPSGAFSIHAGVFAPGGASSIHDHGTWGLVGVWAGQEREERFRRRAGGAGPGHAWLEPTRTVLHRAGSVSTLVPDEDEIHRLTNPGPAAAYSIHVYGRPLRPSREYDLPTGRSGPELRGSGRTAGSPDLA